MPNNLSFMNPQVQSNFRDTFRTPPSSGGGQIKPKSKALHCQRATSLPNPITSFPGNQENHWGSDLDTISASHPIRGQLADFHPPRGQTSRATSPDILRIRCQGSLSSPPTTEELTSRQRNQFGHSIGRTLPQST